MGYLPEIPPLYTEMTVREYLDFVAELKGLDKKVRKTQTEEIMELTHTKEVSEEADPQSLQRISAARRLCTGNHGVSGCHYTG